MDRETERKLAALALASPPAAPRETERSQIVNYIRSMRESGKMDHVIQVFDVLASNIERGDHLK